MAMPPADVLLPGSQAFWLRLGTALLCGGLIGLERQRRGKVAGMRTSILICMGTQVFVTLGAYAAPDRADPTRVLGQVVTGIGFLGAGVILSRGDRILGVTTAAVIWVLAAIGALVGLGYLGSALVITLVTLAVLNGIERAESIWERSPGRRTSGQIHERETE
jgi:putative Mg2+ transporter-C (MgtC) family protein